MGFFHKKSTIETKGDKAVFSQDLESHKKINTETDGGSINAKRDSYLELNSRKEKDRTTIFMSRGEYCAIYDDISMIDEINIDFKDEKGKTVVAYISEYGSPKLFFALYEKHGDSFKNKFSLSTLAKLAVLSGTTDPAKLEVLSKTNVRAPNVRAPLMNLPGTTITDPSGTTGLSFIRRYTAGGAKSSQVRFGTPVLENDFFHTVCCDTRVTKESRAILTEKNEDGYIWAGGYPYLMHEYYVGQNFDALDHMISLTEENNRQKIELMRGTGVSLPVVWILNKTINAASEREDVKYLEKFDKLNRELKLSMEQLRKQFSQQQYSQTYSQLQREKYQKSVKVYMFLMENIPLVSEYEIKMLKLKADKSVSKEEFQLQSAVHDGVVYLDEILAFNDLKLLKRGLKEYAISEMEAKLLSDQKIIDQENLEKQKVLDAIEAEKWRTVFKYAVDINNQNLKNAAVAKDKNAALKCMQFPDRPAQGRTNDTVKRQYSYDDLMRTVGNGVNAKYYLPSLKKKFWPKGCSTAGLLDFFEEYKKELIENTALKYDMEKKVETLTPEYYEKLFKEGNAELLVIKLCVRLEAYLRTKKYEGDFSEMLEKYCNSMTNYDEEGYEWKPDIVPVLQKLRKCRNNIVHSEKNNVTMSSEELRKCMKYIGNLNV